MAAKKPNPFAKKPKGNPMEDNMMAGMYGAVPGMKAKMPTKPAPKAKAKKGKGKAC